MASHAGVNHGLMEWVIRRCCERVAALPDTDRIPAKTALWAMADALEARSAINALGKHAQDPEYGTFEEA
ncbi:hypothetical protein CPLU01_16037 [Colletotrichum plurivorum]|uniref:Uncharacterized protein n=1 Tax=Colletotrichum plurivorum TaxID=2175906 RepID=A0A8H6J1W8_9PEZI|nr:hypothetical protein CPLU01_16037 [Colletotrichum plurivorum]